MNPLLIAVLAGIGGMLGWGFADFFAKKTIDVIGDVQSLAWAGVFGTAAFFPAFLYQILILHLSLSLPTLSSDWFWIALFGALQAAVYLFAYNGFAKGQIAVLNPIFASFAGWVALISILFLGEIASPGRTISLLIIFIGVILVSVDVRALRERKNIFANTQGLWQVAVATILAAIWTLGWNTLVGDKDPVMYAFLMFIFMTITVFLYAFLKRLNMKIAGVTIWIFVALIGICETIAYLSITIGYSTTIFTSIVALISGAFSVPTVLSARFFLGERPLRIQTAGSIVIVVGVALLSLL